jgi:DNA-binding GntR family transcriptional regulator
VNAGCNNPVLLRMLSLVDAFALAARRDRVTNELGGEGTRAAVERYHQHHELLAAVRDGDGALAERLMREHGQVDTTTDV